METRTFTGYAMPDVLVEVEGVWCPGELRQWDHREGGWWGTVQYRGVDGLGRMDTFPADHIKPDDRDYAPSNCLSRLER